MRNQDFNYLFFLLIVFSLPLSLNSQWSTSPDSNLQVSTWGQDPKACTDGNGGVYILWNINSYYTSQYLQRVDRYGYVRWDEPIEIKGEYNGTYFGYSSLSEDGFGGALVSFTEWEVDGDIFPGDWKRRVRVTRIDSSGQFIWDSLGVRVSLIDTSQNLSQVVSDGEGGAFVSFGVIYEYGDQELWIQHISHDGERLWSDDGILVSDSSDVNITHKLIYDGEGGIIIKWLGDDRGMSRFDYNGNLLWYKTLSGIYYDKIIQDGNGGAFLSGAKYAGSYRHIMANHISNMGDFLWGDQGIVVVDSVGGDSDVRDIIFRSDSITAIYYKDGILFGDYQAFIQSLDFDGNVLLEEPKSPSSIIVNKRSPIKLILSDSDNLICFFGDSRNEGNYTVYTQKFDESLNPLWGDSTDVIFSYKSSRSVISDRSGGAIMVWDEAPLNGIFAQQISRNGILGEVITDSMNIENSHSILNKFSLKQNYPNPFNSSTTIEYSIQQVGQITLLIYNVLGNEISREKWGHEHAGTYKFVWDGRDDKGNSVSSGIYLYELRTKNYRDLKKLVLIR